MCLITKQQEPTIIAHDMTVFKLVKKYTSVTNICGSDMQDFDYELEVLNRTYLKEATEDRIPYDDQVTKHYGLRYDNKTGMTISKEVRTIGPGFHSFSSKERIGIVDGETSERIARFLMPSGSEIFQDETGVLVSNQIIFKAFE